MTTILVIGLVTTAITELWMTQSGPWQLIAKTKYFLSAKSPKWIAEVWTCPVCFGFWVAGIVTATTTSTHEEIFPLMWLSGYAVFRLFLGLLLRGFHDPSA